MFETIREFAGTVIQEWHSRNRKREIKKNTPAEWVQHLQPDIEIEKIWYGTSYGGFFIHPDVLSKGSVIYSFGVGKDISFDRVCMKNHSASIFAFDPTPKSISWIQKQQLSSDFSFFPFGIGTESGTQRFYLPKNKKSVSGSLVSSVVMDADSYMDVPMKSFPDILAELRHTTIDVIKMDIEGAEYEVLDSILNSPVFVGQILVEFHDRMFDSLPFRSVDAVEKLREKGYLLFGISESYEEVSFIHRSLIHEKTQTPV